MKCLKCEKDTKNPKFCSLSCSSSYNNSKRVMAEETKNKITESIIKHRKLKLKINPTSILQLSGRTITKVFKRLNISCSLCGWDKGTCDIHHIKGRKINNADSHDNLTVVCPNCHRLIHEGKIAEEDIKTLEFSLPENWVDYYYI